MTEKKTKLLRLLDALTPNKQVDFSNLDNDFKRIEYSFSKLKSQLQEKVQAQTLSDVNRQMKNFQKKLDFTDIKSQIKQLDEDYRANFDSLVSSLTDAYGQISQSLDGKTNTADTEALVSVLEGIGQSLDQIKSEYDTSIQELSLQLSDLGSKADDLGKEMKSLDNTTEDKLKSKVDITKLQDTVDQTTSQINKLREDIMNRMASLQSNLDSRGGGGISRQISIGGNSSVLSKYNDINLKAGSNVTLSYTNNETTKQVDVTISATGGSGSGITRSINNISTSQTGGAVAGTDYVYIATQGVLLTLPTAVGNANLYTIKNAAASSVMVAADGAENIDGDSNLILAVRYTSVDLISDGSNWKIT